MMVLACRSEGPASVTADERRGPGLPALSR